MARKTLVCFGDSNTHGTCPMRHLDDVRRFDRETRWPGVVSRILGADWDVVEEGHPGRTTVFDDPVQGVHKNGLPAVLACLETHRPVDWIVILLGTNDLQFRFALQAIDIARGAEKLVVQARMSACGREAGAPEILLVAPPVILETGCLAESFTGGAEKSGKLASHYAACANRQNCAFLDAATVVESSAIDGIHWDRDAHQALGRAVAAILG
jgi:lysophospholipase L1-like esterase